MNNPTQWQTGMYVMLSDLSEYEMAIIQDWTREVDNKDNQQFIIFGPEDCLGIHEIDYGYWCSEDLTTRITAQKAMAIVGSNQ